MAKKWSIFIVPALCIGTTLTGKIWCFPQIWSPGTPLSLLSRWESVFYNFVLTRQKMYHFHQACAAHKKTYWHVGFLFFSDVSARLLPCYYFPDENLFFAFSYSNARKDTIFIMPARRTGNTLTDRVWLFPQICVLRYSPAITFPDGNLFSVFVFKWWRRMVFIMTARCIRGTHWHVRFVFFPISYGRWRSEQLNAPILLPSDSDRPVEAYVFKIPDIVNTCKRFFPKQSQRTMVRSPKTL